MVDAVNALASTRAAWRAIAQRAGVAVVEVEVVCSDVDEHRRRIASRVVEIPGLKLATWSEVETREYQAWVGEHIVIDTAGRPVERSVTELYALLLLRERAVR